MTYKWRRRYGQNRYTMMNEVRTNPLLRHTTNKWYWRLYFANVATVCQYLNERPYTWIRRGSAPLGDEVVNFLTPGTSWYPRMTWRWRTQFRISRTSSGTPSAICRPAKWSSSGFKRQGQILFLSLLSVDDSSPSTDLSGLSLFLIFCVKEEEDARWSRFMGGG